MSKAFESAHRLPTWRKVAASTWRASDDPSIYGWMDVDVSALLDYVARLRASTGVRVTVTHVVGKAVAMAFADCPESNALVSWGRLLRRPTVDVFFSVAVGDGKGLAGAKVTAADGRSLVDIAHALTGDVERIRGRKDTPLQKSQQGLRRLPAPLLGPLMRAVSAISYDLGVDLSSVGVPFDIFGTVVVTNVGVLGIEQGFAPLIPTGRAAALITVGKIRDKVIAVDGEPRVRPVLTLGATFDHRIVDGHHLGRISERLHTILASPDQHLDPCSQRSSNGLAGSALDGPG